MSAEGPEALKGKRLSTECIDVFDGEELHCPPEQDINQVVALDQPSIVHLSRVESTQKWRKTGVHHVDGGKPNMDN